MESVKEDIKGRKLKSERSRIHSLDRAITQEFKKMDNFYNQEPDSFTAQIVHYDNYINEETEANITREPSGSYY